jgi:hypothetical protein
MFDERDIDVPLPSADELRSASARILQNVKDPNQRAMLRSVMESRAWSIAEMGLLVRQQERELSRYRSLGANAERAIEENKELRKKLASAERARNAAQRAASDERSRRLAVEEEIEAVIAAVHEANAGESRLSRLVTKLETEHRR